MSAPVVVAVVSWNTRELLERCLESLRADAEAGLADVWVVDNASTDASAQVVPDWARCVALEENVGFGAAVDLVAERTSSPWLVAANADVAVTAGALAALVEAGAQDPCAGALAPRLVLPDGTTQHSVYPFPSVPFAAAFNVGLAQRFGDRLCLEGHWNADRARRVPWAIAAFLLVRRAAYAQVGGFGSERWMYAEDLDLGWRLHRHGWSTRYVPAAVVQHESAASTSALWGEERTVRWQAATYDWLRRARSPLAARAVYSLNVAGAAVRGRGSGWQAERSRRWADVHRRAWREGAPQASSTRAASSPSRTA
jgi:GT2 family glycosyltransferase